MKVFLMDEEHMDVLRSLEKRLHSGTDKERDYGHILWLLCNELESSNVIEMDEGKML
jgi:hypothetical protein